MSRRHRVPRTRHVSPSEPRLAHANWRNRSSPSNLYGFSCKHFATESFQTSIVVVPRISYGLAKLGGDLLEGVSLEEKKQKRLALLFRQFFKPASQGIRLLHGLSENICALRRFCQRIT